MTFLESRTCYPAALPHACWNPASLPPRDPAVLGTIVAPFSVLLILGLQSFERQRQALDTLTAEKLERELRVRTRAEAVDAFEHDPHPIALYRFRIEGGQVVEPRLRAPLPSPAPVEFGTAELLAMSEDRLDRAVVAYRTLLGHSGSRHLALSGLARSLARAGRFEEARATWRTLARDYSDAWV